MQPWPDTRDTLLTRLQNPADQQAWDEFVQLYQPLIFGFARSRGVQDADARDITQRVLWAVARAADRWEPGRDRGRFRGWLARVTTNAVINLVQRESQHRGSGPDQCLGHSGTVAASERRITKCLDAPTTLPAVSACGRTGQAGVFRGSLAGLLEDCRRRTNVRASCRRLGQVHRIDLRSPKPSSCSHSKDSCNR